jgi:CDP-4-dehydro-6-deoxyglucose reductase
VSNTLTHARVVRITPLTNSILQLILELEEYVDYQAGQYLQIISENQEFSYSIANAPLGSHNYELHIRHTRDNPYNQPFLAEIKRKGAVTIRLPLGTCDVSHLHPNLPILFIAGGTGFAPIKAMIEQLLATGEPRAFELFWGARSQSDLYMDDKVMQWQNHVSNFKYFSQLSETSTQTLASMVLARHQQDINNWQVVISGPFDMVYSTRDQLVDNGALASNLFSDAFSFEGEK